MTAKLHDGRFVHKMLPAPLEKIEVTARAIDGRVPLATLKAASGAATVEARVADFDIPFDYPRPPELRFDPAFAELSGEISKALRGAH